MYLRLTTSKTLTCIKKSLSYSTNSGTFPFQCKKIDKRWQCLKLQISNFHTTQKLNYPGSLLLCFGSIYCGHCVRKWWLKQTPEQQLKYIIWFRQKKRIFYGSLGFLSFVLVFCCLTHLEVDPIKKKSRLILFDQTQQIEDSKIFYRMIVQNEKNIVPLRDPKYRIIARALKKLIYSNKDLFENTDWTITIIHRMFNIASFPNVMILPDRNIIVLVDIFNFIKNSDQLTFILAHEMSHIILLHTSEIPTFATICTIATIVSSFLIWIFYERRVAAILCSVLYTTFAAIFSSYKRQKEIEADDVGLELAAKSCIDIREVLVFWEIMMKFEELSGQNKFQIPLFMDHPALEERKKRTIQLMPTILELRKQAKCHELPARDPRDRLPYYLKDIEKHMLKDTKILDVDFPIIYSSNNAFNYFGYTVHLYYEMDTDISWLIVGAPKENYSWYSTQKFPYLIEPGVVYRCAIKNDECQEVRPEKIENEEGYDTRYEMKTIIRKQFGWFGSAISIDESNGILTVCAPRTIVMISKPFTDINFETMQGMCYSGEISSNTLFIENNLKSYNFGTKFWYNPLYGFSFHHASTKQTESSNDKKRGKVNYIVGKPKHEDFGTVDIMYSNEITSIELSSLYTVSQFGYSVESGYFFKKDQLLFASGAPGWNYVGMVVIINPETKSLTKLNGTNIGEFFGASLAVGDINNDGLDDLLIGAPYCREDNGRVYVYFGTFEERFEMAHILDGHVQGAHFGYAIASGDLDADGYDDIIVGSPWEDNGVIYIFNGGSSNLQMTERIEPAKFFRYSSQKIQRFGFSISKPVDIDANGYLDIAVGAYKSGIAVILRSKPIIKTELLIETVPNTLQRNATHFLVKTCPVYTIRNTLHSKGVIKFKITVTIDERYQRTKQTTLELKSSNLISDICLSAQVNISKNIRDFIEPISIFAKHDFLYDNVTTDFCKYCPIEKRNNKLQIAQTLLPFNIGCGEDKVCNSNISATAKFYNVQFNDTWVIGSSDISLEITLKNYGEPAYLAMLEFTFPKGIILRSILPFCHEDNSKENLIVICDTGNPIWNEEERSVKLDLDMKLINGSYDDKLYFNATIKTRSINHGTANIIKILNLVNEVSLFLHGKANEEAYYLTTSTENSSNITFQHTYEVYKHGASPIESAQLIIKVPLAIEDLKTLIYMYKPQLYISGELFECSSENILLDNQLDMVEEEPFFGQFDERNVETSVLYLHDVKNIQTSEKLNKNWMNDITYINCTSEINCTTFVCSLNTLKTLQDVGKDNRAVLKFSTEVSVEIIKPDVRLDINGTRSTMEVITTFYYTSKTEKLQLWIIFVSVLVGLLLLCTIATILNMLGFFKRKGKQDLAKQENNEIIENGNTIMSCD
ncbi:Integrin alpha-4 [Melipona quadrifasciata]|uniref:Integrin alpha-4 n=1 Tax=Melipona quadrifasciata TaxID=166423 RepID=A0A0M8ZZN4_9HYME|nr:Integrin alpha-4 [Melipona quadrifasciata]